MRYGYQRTINLLWHSGYFDGPISGVCEIDGQKFWFDQIAGDQGGELWVKHIDESFDINDEDTFNYDIIRFYKVYRLPDDVMDKVIFNHEVFRKYVGHHTDYVNNHRELGCHPRCMWDQYTTGHVEINLKEHLNDNNCIGWFDSNSIWNNHL